jgi:CRP/FNR family cyclic AMP-dependent transcriptional regulator
MFEFLPLFSSLSKKDLALLTRHATARTLPAHARVLSEGEKSDSLYIILYGRVKVFVTGSNGDEVILSLQGRGECFGELGLLDEAPRSASVATMETTRLASLSKADFKDCLAQHPDVAYNLLRLLTARVRELTESVRNLALLDVYGRIARTLLHLAKPEGDVLVIDQKLTQQEIANMVGASREMTSRILNDLAAKGCIKMERRRITLFEKLSKAGAPARSPARLA